MNIDLHADDLRIWIGMPFNESEILSSQFSKIGFLLRLTSAKLKAPGDIIYWAKNPTITCFDGATSAIPKASGVRNADLICGTSVFLHFNDGQLRLAFTQVIMSYIWAQEFTNEFRKLAIDNFGKAECADLASVPTHKGSSIKNSIHLTCAWRDGKEFLISNLAPRGDNANIFWGRDK